MTLFSNIDEVRAIIADTGDVPVLSDEALAVILNACQSDIDFACGGPNQIGVVFENERISFETIAVGNSLNVSFGIAVRFLASVIIQHLIIMYQYLLFTHYQQHLFLTLMYQ